MKVRELNPEERRRIREAARLQQVISWLSRELEMPAPDLPHSSTRTEPDDIAREIRARPNLTLDAQLAWSSTSEAHREWREAMERLGVLALVLPMGEESCRGFSMWDDAAPLIAINTTWVPEARVFTMLHEIAHLVTRTNSACAEDGTQSTIAGDRVERWCERVAAAVAVPAEGLSKVLSEMATGSTRSSADLSTVNRIASRLGNCPRWLSRRDSSFRHRSAKSWNGARRIIRAMPRLCGFRNHGRMRSSPRTLETVQRVLARAPCLVDVDSKRDQADPYVIALALDSEALGSVSILSDDRRDRYDGHGSLQKLSVATAAGLWDLPVVPLAGFILRFLDQT